MKKFISVFFVFAFLLLVNFTNVLASQIQDDSLNKIANDDKKGDILSKNNIDKISNSNSNDIFGDEQTFPFISGFGNNSAR